MSEAASSPGSSSLASPSIQMVSKSVSERLLGKFFIFFLWLFELTCM
ncbi:hypothetical protein NC652_004781 [Populus alba x Populus x berolinensis]|nr:hypothetical protein NC652_004010 [Populus alba x Populus x berolinensis]KAJ6967312.1 hypothetical protein NC652_004767 [Populus alba x Populus x berolinensis]KAJ6967313.1 hypothetical protein NC652_004768 [Populus alba x Populus x berolinensis]KAJ6967330.1 hypothetical protein NC652_004781 [Populus alba x Populus x berolinensis]